MSYAIPKEEVDDDNGGEILGVTDDGDKYFCSLKVHHLVTQIQIQRRTVLPFDIARLPLGAK